MSFDYDENERRQFIGDIASDFFKETDMAKYINIIRSISRLKVRLMHLVNLKYRPRPCPSPDQSMAVRQLHRIEDYLFFRGINAQIEKTKGQLKKLYKKRDSESARLNNSCRQTIAAKALYDVRVWYSRSATEIINHRKNLEVSRIIKQIKEVGELRKSLGS